MAVEYAKGFQWGRKESTWGYYKICGYLSKTFLNQYIGYFITTQSCHYSEAPLYAAKYDQDEDGFVEIDFFINYNFEEIIKNISNILCNKLYNYKVSLDEPHIIVVYMVEDTDCYIDNNEKIILNEDTEKLIRYLWEICAPQYNLNIKFAEMAQSPLIVSIINHDNNIWIKTNNNIKYPAQILKQKRLPFLQILIIAIIIYKIKRVVPNITRAWSFVKKYT